MRGGAAQGEVGKCVVGRGGLGARCLAVQLVSAVVGLEGGGSVGSLGAGCVWVGSMQWGVASGGGRESAHADRRCAAPELGTSRSTR
jgi:hypothetical protein